MLQLLHKTSVCNEMNSCKRSPFKITGTLHTNWLLSISKTRSAHWSEKICNIKALFPVLSPGFIYFLSTTAKLCLRFLTHGGCTECTDYYEARTDCGTKRKGEEERLNERSLCEAEMIDELPNKGVRWPDRLAMLEQRLNEPLAIWQ